MTQVLNNRLTRLESMLGLVPSDVNDDEYFELHSAERRLAAHQAFTEMLRGLVSDEERARQDAAFEPGPRRVRRLSPGAQKQLDEMLATRCDNAREVEVGAILPIVSAGSVD